MHTLKFIRRRLASYHPVTYEPQTTTRQAAVAVILHDSGSTTDILFIKRAEKTGDPWSGHMAFPGGHLDPQDPDLKAAAVRETLEEIGLDISGAEYLGALDQERAMPRGRPLNMLIAPHVFALHNHAEFTLNHEVDEVVWTDLARLMNGDRHAWETKSMAGQPTVFNGYRLEAGHFVWGLTYRMLKSFFTTLDGAWQGPPER